MSAILEIATRDIRIFFADFPSRPGSRTPESLVAESYDRDRVGWVFVLNGDAN
jgi:hypothetical protein